MVIVAPAMVNVSAPPITQIETTDAAETVLSRWA
jgi:hypothetical protein